MYHEFRQSQIAWVVHARLTRPTEAGPGWSLRLLWTKTLDSMWQLAGDDHTLLGTNMFHLGKRKVIFKSAFKRGYVSSLECNLWILQGVHARDGMTIPPLHLKRLDHCKGERCFQSYSTITLIDPVRPSPNSIKAISPGDTFDIQSCILWWCDDLNPAKQNY